MAAGGRGAFVPPETLATAQPCTLQEYAHAERLRVEQLRRLGLADVRYQGRTAVRIPYKDPDGEEVAVRFRMALDKSEGDRFRWRRGDKPTLYGLWLLDRMKKAGYVVLVEGESDCHTLWQHGVPALGVPGAGVWREEWATYLEGSRGLRRDRTGQRGRGAAREVVRFERAGPITSSGPGRA